MGKLKQLLLSFALIFASAFVLTVSASAAGVKESVEDFTGDVYIIGSTKFDNNTSVTASRAAQAGSDEMLLQIINGNFEFQRNKIKTYLYSEIEELWFEVPKDGGELIELTETEVETIEDNLNIYFVNDNEKMIEFEYTGGVNTSTITSTDSLSGAEVRYEGGKFYIPVTTVELKFETTTGEKVSIVTEYDEEDKLDFGEYYIPITVTVLDADGKLIPDFYVQTTKDGKISSVDRLLDYPGVKGYQVYYVDANGLPIDFDTFVVTAPISIKQAWTPRGTLNTENSEYGNSATEIVHTGNIYEDENGTYIKAFLLAPKGYDTTNTKVNGEAATFVDEKMSLKLYFESISDVKEVKVEWEEGIEVTFEVSIDPEEAEYAYTVKYYNDQNQEIETIYGVTQGSTLEEPKYTYEKVDYVFDGWTTDVETNVKYDFANGVNANLKLYPRFVTLKEFVENSSIENPAVLRSNVTTTTTALITKDADMVLDLGGYTITMNSNTDDIIRMKGNNASLTIKSGKMIAGGYAAAVVIGKSKEDTSSVTKRDLTIANDVVIEADYYGIAAFGKSKVDFYGTLNLSEAGYAISGNGLENNEGTLFNIYDGSEISAPNGIVLYLPQLGETNILGGTLTGSTVVGIKAGTLNVSGGTLTSTGDYVAPKPTNDGMDFTGDVIIAEENSFYADHIQINITGGKLVKEGEGTALIREYNPSLGTENERYVKVKGLYAFKTKVDDITYVFAESTNGDFVYDETYYAKEELQTYLEKSSETKPVVITKDITLTKDMIFNVDADMVLDLGGKTITSEVDIIRLKGNNSSLVVKNGTMITTGNSSAPLKIGASKEDTTGVTKREIVVMADVVLNTNGYGVAVFGKSKLDMYGKIIVNGAGYGISGNGLKNNEGTLINIYEGAEISAPNSAALYLPQLGETNIYGGTFTGNSVIGIKAGTLNITGGTFTSTGDYVAPKPTNDGMDATGDVIIAEENSAYADHIQINITGATLTANGKDTALIREYNPSLGTENERYVTVTGAYATKNKVDDITYTYTKTVTE